MAVGSGIRLNGALSILLVILLVLGGMASMTSLESGDAALSSEGSADETDDGRTTGETTNNEVSSEAQLRELCQQVWNRMDGNEDRDQPMPRLFTADSADGRQSDSAGNHHGNDSGGHDGAGDGHGDSGNHGDDSNDPSGNHHGDGANDHDGGHDGGGDGHDDPSDHDWHLPDYISVQRTATGDYVIRITHDDGTVTEEVLTAEEFAEFLEDWGWQTDPETDEQHDWVDEDEEHDWSDEWLEDWAHDWVEEEIPEIAMEILDDGTIIIVRDNGDYVEYDIIRTSDSGETTIIRVTPWATEVIHPSPEAQQQWRGGSGAHDEWGGEMAPLLDVNIDYDEETMQRCRRMMHDNEGDSPDGPVMDAHPSPERERRE